MYCSAARKVESSCGAEVARNPPPFDARQGTIYGSSVDLKNRRATGSRTCASLEPFYPSHEKILREPIFNNETQKTLSNCRKQIPRRGVCCKLTRFSCFARIAGRI